MKKLFLIFLLTVQTLLVAAQVSVEARIDSIEMMMGEQVHVTLTVSAPEGSKININAGTFTINNLPVNSSGGKGTVSVENDGLFPHAISGR